MAVTRINLKNGAFHFVTDSFDRVVREVNFGRDQGGILVKFKRSVIVHSDTKLEIAIDSNEVQSVRLA